MSKKAGIFITILSVVAIIISIIAFIICIKPAAAPETAAVKDLAEAEVSPTDIQYVLYLGTNDKDTEYYF